MDISGETLLYMWKESGLSQRELAKQYGWNFNEMHGLIFRAQKKEAQLIEEKIQVEDQHNSRVIDAYAPRIKTLEDLIRACEIDLEEWIIDKHLINKWEVGAKVKKGSIAFNKGVMDGEIEFPGELTIEPLFQVKAWLVKRCPEPIHPVIVPVQLNFAALPPASVTRNGKLPMSLILADPHFGFSRTMDGKLTNFHNRKSLSVALQVAAFYPFENIVFLGDILDLADWTDKFLRSPELEWTTQPAINEAAWWLYQFRQVCPTAKTTILEGNHDKRLSVSLIKHMAQAYELRPALMTDGPALMSIPNLLSLRELGIDYVGDYPNGEVWVGDVRCTHGIKARAKSGATAAAVVEEAQVSEVFAHIHRIEMATKTLWGKEPKTVTAMSLGCLCRLDGVVPSKHKKMNWQSGIGIVCDNVCVSVPIDNDRAIFNGKVFEAEDVSLQLERDTGIMKN